MTSAVPHFAPAITTARSAPSRDAACSTPSSTNRSISPATSSGPTTDVVGVSGAPFHPASAFRNFQVKVAPDGKDLLIAPGRIYVDGILCENEAEPAKLLAQPDLPGAALPTAAGSYAVFLDVWERHVSAGEQRADGFPPIREAALGGADTASRVRVVWQVRPPTSDRRAAVRSRRQGRRRASCAPAKRRRARPQTTASFPQAEAIGASRTSCIALKCRR